MVVHTSLKPLRPEAVWVNKVAGAALHGVGRKRNGGTLGHSVATDHHVLVCDPAAIAGKVSRGERYAFEHSTVASIMRGASCL